MRFNIFIVSFEFYHFSIFFLFLISLLLPKPSLYNPKFYNESIPFTELPKYHFPITKLVIPSTVKILKLSSQNKKKIFKLLMLNYYSRVYPKSNNQQQHYPSFNKEHFNRKHNKRHFYSNNNVSNNSSPSNSSYKPTFPTTNTPKTPQIKSENKSLSSNSINVSSSP